MTCPARSTSSMSSRPPRPQPSRGSGMLREAQQRNYLNNQLGTPGSSRHNVVDLTNGPEPSTSAPARPGAPGRLASGLRLETIAEGKEAKPTPEAQPQATLPWPVAPPPWPRGKPKFMFSYHNPPQEDNTNQSPSFAGSTASPQKETIPIPLPFPARPVKREPPARDRSLALANAIPSQKKDKAPKPYALEVPVLAPNCPSKFNLDFFPWTGDHPEDKFSQKIIADGYFDKLVGSFDKETLAGKATIAPHLKQQNSLKMLSHVFTAVLDSRRKNSLITSAPTFKPPPRVTLTDTKKENWLKDLANPSISLRRLSRTIPHGIKNKILLEQCMDKEVPMERAVWLAKCVGANEIRASKRTKGAAGAVMSGGEAKWIRDWTVCVEQFIESTTTLFGEAAHKMDGKSKFMYCIRLSSYLFSEQLLDSAHYLDYIISSLEGSDIRKLPARLLVAEVHSEDLLRYRKTGRRYVAALCSKLQSMDESVDKDIIQPIIDKVGSIVKGIILSHPESFLSSKKWPQYKATIEAAISYLGPEGSERLDVIDRRHSRLRLGLPSSQSVQGPRREVIRLLDSTFDMPFTLELGRACWKAMKPRTELAQTVFDWATSRHRPGSAKVFIAARLLRIWRRHDLDVNEAALHFLSRVSHSTTISRDALYHLYSELTKSGHFSVSRYAHWLIARGGLRSVNDVAVDGPVGTRLLAELSLHDVPEPSLRLRKTLLHRASFSVEEEQATIERIWRAIEASLDNLAKEHGLHMDSNPERNILQSVPGISRTMKAELGIRLRLFVKGALAGPKDTNRAARTISQDNFVFIRSILEQTEDISMLADVLKMVSTCSASTAHILALCTDTINVHRESLAAVGAFKDLFDILVARYRTLSMAHGSEVAQLLTSLCELAAKTSDAKALYIELSKEVARSAHKATVEACSPVSDYVVEVLSKGEASCSDEIEKLLDSGGSMEHTTFVRLFELIVSQIETLWAKQALSVQKYSALLGQLRAFDPKLFSSKLTAWLDDVVQRAQRPSIAHILGPLISFDCVGFGEVLKSCSALLQSKKGGVVATTSRIALETLDLALGSPGQEAILDGGDSHKLNIRRVHAQSAYYSTILEIVRHIIEMELPSTEGHPDGFTALCERKAFVEFFQRLVIIHVEVLTNSLVLPLAKSADTRVLARLRILLRSLLDLPTTEALAADLEPANRVTTIIGVASDLTLPFCQLALRSVFAGENPERMVLGDDSTNGTPPLLAFENAVDLALAVGNTTWTSIIPMLDVHVARHLFESAERQLVTGLAGKGSEELARQKLAIIEATAYSIHGHRNPSMVFLLTEKVNDIVRHATSSDNRQQYLEALPLVLEIISVLTADLDGVKQAGEMRLGFLMMLATLHLFLRSKNVGTEDLRQMVFDTILCLADELGEEARIRCINQLLGHAPIELGIGTPSASITTPAMHSGNFATTPSGAGMSPAQATFQIAAQPQLGTGTATTPAMDPELCYALSFGRDKRNGLVIMQKGKMVPFQIKRWEALSEPTPLVGENDTSLNMRLFEARKN